MRDPIAQGVEANPGPGPLRARPSARCQRASGAALARLAEGV